MLTESTHGARRHRQGVPPWNCSKVLFVLQMLSRVSVFMHYFEKMLSDIGATPQTPPGAAA